ncbi:selenocysteine lyase [Streptomyces lydicamycinicus]|uniref:Selenocysteine lyase n=1 Tax=Streptomyces lydicamycinicus TaxID=1546107 RepID=A0A0P4R9S8_9ACTN|nr:selenocysteine lyase [Streptomyces lydicamycinicus]
MQIGGGGEPHADQVVRAQLVALQNGGEQRADLLLHVLRVVPLQLDGPADRSYRHVTAPLRYVPRHAPVRALISVTSRTDNPYGGGRTGGAGRRSARPATARAPTVAEPPGGR